MAPAIRKGQIIKIDIIQSIQGQSRI